MVHVGEANEGKLQAVASMSNGGTKLSTQSLGTFLLDHPSSRIENRSISSSLSKRFLLILSNRLLPSVVTMGSARCFPKRVRSVTSLKRISVESVVMKVIERVRASGYSEEVCLELRKHFARLPGRYTLNIDALRHEDVLLHMKLLRDAWKAESSTRNNLSAQHPLPQVYVRKVQLGPGTSPDFGDHNGVPDLPRAMAIPRILKSAFCSSNNLAGLMVAGPKVHPSNSSPPSDSTLVSRSATPGSGLSSIPRPTFGSCVNLSEMDEDNLKEGSYGYEITLATSDRRGLLKLFTTALCNSTLQLNIKEAHVFSTTDGMALENFVVEGWPGNEPEELKQAVLGALSEINKTDSTIGNQEYDFELKSAVESIAYEDWTVDFNHLVTCERLGGGSSSQLYRGKYLSQDVAIKIIELDYDMSMQSDSSGNFCAAPAYKLLQMFKQEVSIMRLVRHKNLVQFIGACSQWPKLCIVTELMAGGSVRDIMEHQGCGLDIPAAVKVLRDAARGMDFLHRRDIVHRDLKAANLLIDEYEVVKVCDFGVARLLPEAACHSGTGIWQAEMTAETGTYRWMAPEVLEHKSYDQKADVYSFGIMIWEVVTGEVPYAGLTPMQAAIGVVQRGLRPTMPTSVPAKLTQLAEQCWHQDPDQRPEFSEVLVLLEEIMKPTLLRTSFFRKKK